MEIVIIFYLTQKIIVDENIIFCFSNYDILSKLVIAPGAIMRTNTVFNFSR